MSIHAPYVSRLILKFSEWKSIFIAERITLTSIVGSSCSTTREKYTPSPFVIFTLRTVTLNKFFCLIIVSWWGALISLRVAVLENPRRPNYDKWPISLMPIVWKKLAASEGEPPTKTLPCSLPTFIGLLPSSARLSSALQIYEENRNYARNS